MTASDALLAYVEASAGLLGVPLDAARAQRVAAHLQRTAGMAALLDAVELTPDDEATGVYLPAPFPDAAPA